MLEKDIVNSIMRYLKTVPMCFAWKEHGGMYGTAGLPDIICCYRGRFVAFEVKTPSGRLTKIQESMMRKINEANVCGYGRVSSPKDAMIHSLSAQVSYYNDLIQKTKGWAFAGVYTDEAKTGTKENRPGFQQMLEACRAGKVDMVITNAVMI